MRSSQSHALQDPRRPARSPCNGPRSSFRSRGVQVAAHRLPLPGRGAKPRTGGRRRSELGAYLASRGRSASTRPRSASRARFLTLRNGRHREAIRHERRQVLHASVARRTRSIALASSASSISLVKRPFVADLGQRHVGDFISGCPDDLDAAGLAQLLQPAFDPARLPESEL